MKASPLLFWGIVLAAVVYERRRRACSDPNVYRNPDDPKCNFFKIK